MRVLSLVCLSTLFFCACSKDKYTTQPQIEYKSIDFNYVENIAGAATPSITFKITDAEGDLGITLRDTAFIHIKNVRTGDSALLPFPDLKEVVKKDFKADVAATLPGSILFSCPVPNSLDTTFFEIYVTDFGKNKSNTIVTEDPIFIQCP